MAEIDSQDTEPTFDEILSRLEVESRLDPAIRAADYLVAASMLDDDKDVLYEARKRLLLENPQELYLTFLKFCVQSLKAVEKRHQYRYAKQINDVAIAGLGVWQEDLGLTYDGQETIRITGEPNWELIREH